MKKFFIVLTMVIASVSMSAQTVSHTVQRGETIESIAQKYSVSVEDLKNANPDAKEYFYVGMKLSIPAKPASISNLDLPASTTNNNAYTPSNTTNYNSSNNSNLTETNEVVGHFQPAIEAFFGYLIPSIADGNETGFCFSMSCAFGAKYHFTNELFAEALAGYKYEMMSVGPKDSKYTDKTHYTIHNITFPLHLGYDITKDFSAFVGTRIDIPVSAKSELKDEESDMDLSTTALIECGIKYKMVSLKFDYSPAKSNKYSLISIGLKI